MKCADIVVLLEQLQYDQFGIAYLFDCPWQIAQRFLKGEEISLTKHQVLSLVKILELDYETVAQLYHAPSLKVLPKKEKIKKVKPTPEKRPRFGKEKKETSKKIHALKNRPAKEVLREYSEESA